MNSEASSTASSASPIKLFQVDSLNVRVYRDPESLARDVAAQVHGYLQDLLSRQPAAAAILATGNSQIAFLEALLALGGIAWDRMTLFHMDEYLGISADHSASFRKYMRERVAARVRPRQFHYLEGDALQPLRECDRYTGLLRAQPIDLCCLGVGENGHLAFNDPPVAEFDDPRAVKIVKLDRECRQQQVGEGHFPGLEAVPQYALTLTLPTLCSARKMICIVPEKRKARAVKAALTGAIGPECPASLLRRQPQATLFLDQDSASLL